MPLWFGPERSPLFGVLHLPESSARGAVIICPPIGREYTSSHSTFVRLAVELAGLGIAALRFDYRSTGDSFDRLPDGSGGPGFEEDVRCAVDFVRKMEVASIGIVGMRLGANFAAAQCCVEPVNALVLWDACPSGRSFLREQRALGLLVGLDAAPSPPGAVEVPSYKLTPEMTEEISGADLVWDRAGAGGSAHLADNVLLLTRSGRAAAPKLFALVDRNQVEHVEVAGQAELLEVQPPRQKVPEEALGIVARWLDRTMPSDSHPIKAPTRDKVTVAMAKEPFGPGDVPGDDVVLVRERSVWLGPTGLFGIETEPVEGATGPACIFVSVANEHRIGPGRLWVQLSRRLAAGGFRSVRVDIDGFGDSPARDERLEASVVSVLGIDDILDTARAVSPDDPSNVVLIGHSSSGYLILEAALSLAPRGVCSVNPWLVFQPPEMAAGAAMDERRRFCLSKSAFAAALVTRARDQTRLRRLDQRFPSLATRIRIPVRKAAWFLRSVATPQMNRPGERVGDLVNAGTEVLLICGAEDIQPFNETGLGAVRRADNRGRLQVEEIPALEHSLLAAHERDEVAELIVGRLLSRFGPPAAT